ncbi:MAG: 1-acyl-sn-glycerol-3-phosphate acyltransferase [Polyangiales bacterium]
MARRVLGDDPFSDGAPEEPAADAKAKSGAPKRPSGAPKPRASAPPKPRASTAPKPRASTPPKAPRRSKAPPADAAVSEVIAPPPAKLPVIEQPEGETEIDFAVRISAEPEAPPEVVISEGDGASEVVISATAEAAPEVELDDEALVQAPQQEAASAAATATVTDANAVAEEPSEEPVGGADLPPEVAVDERSSVVAHGADASPEDLERTIRELEARLDTLLEASKDQAQPLLERVTDKLRAAAAGATVPRADTTERDEAGAFDVNKELLASDFYLRRWGRVAMRDRAEEVDAFGYDPSYDARLRPLFDFLYDRWWRIDVEGIDAVPAEGRVALVANHSGAIPYDGIMLAAAMRKEHPTGRQLRWLAEDFVSHLPFMGAWLTRLGAVRACQENAERLLRNESCVAMFPEGVKGIAKLYRDRYKLQRFGRGGHIKLAIRTRTPIVPVAIVGAEETHPLLGPSNFFARLLSVPYVPITPTFPLLGAAGALPLPSKWRIIFCDPMPMDSYGPDAADDEVLVGRLNEKLRTTIQDTLDRALRQRRSIFRG